MNASGGSTSNRNLPDVAMPADHVEIVDHDGQVGGIAGTSCAAPLWNGFTVLINQQAALYGLPSVGFLNPRFMRSARPNHNNDFHDMTFGSNNETNNPSGYNCVAGYDLVSGWGSPNGAGLINDLAGVAFPTTTPTPTPVPSATWRGWREEVTDQLHRLPGQPLVRG